MEDLSLLDNFGVQFTTVLSIVLSLLIYIRFTGWYTIPKNASAIQGGKPILGLKDIPNLKPFLPIKFLGNLPQVLPLTSSIEKALKIAEENPGLMRATGFNKDIILLNSCSLIQQLFKSTEFGHNTKSNVVYDFMKPFISNGLLVSTGTFWQNQRKLLMKTQSFSSLKAYIGMLNKHSNEFINELDKLFKDGQPHTMNESINVLFLKVICEMITGHEEKSSPEFDRYHHNFQLWKESLLTRVPWFIHDTIWKLHPMSRRQRQAVEEMCDFAKQRIQEHKEEVTKEGGDGLDSRNEPKSSRVRCMLDDLIEAGVDDNQIVDEVNTMLFGGHETGATAIHFFCLCMALNPEMQDQCRKEIDEMFSSSGNEYLTYEDAQSGLKYLERCIQETLRLFPPVFIVLRRLLKPLILEQDNKTFRIPEETILLVAPLANHRNPLNFPDPKKFDPDRFLPEKVAKRDSYAYIPFSGGPRNCLGIKFAMLEMKIVAAYLLRNFEIRTKETSLWDVPLMPFITTTPQRDYVFELSRRPARSAE